MKNKIINETFYKTFHFYFNNIVKMRFKYFSILKILRPKLIIKIKIPYKETTEYFRKFVNLSEIYIQKYVSR